MSSWLTAERLRATCERVVADDGKAFAGKLLDNVPAALIALLPLMALILKVLYPLSKRYYVEHVLFVVHFHAFVFLILTLQILFSRLTSVLTLSDTISTVTTVAVTLYIPIYFFKAMRRVYQQNWFVTIVEIPGPFIGVRSRSADNPDDYSGAGRFRDLVAAPAWQTWRNCLERRIEHL